MNRSINGTALAPAANLALWCSQVAHQTCPHPVYGNNGLVVMDNFYTRLVLAKQLHLSVMVSAMYSALCEKIVKTHKNRPNLKHIIEELKHAGRGEWQLCQGMENPITLHGTPVFCDCSGFFVFKDQAMVIFYTNRLAAMPKLPAHEAEEDSIEAFHGPASFPHWLGTESMRNFQLMLPSMIMGYNLFMTGVDKFDKNQGTAPIMGK